MKMKIETNSGNIIRRKELLGLVDIILLISFAFLMLVPEGLESLGTIPMILIWICSGIHSILSRSIRKYSLPHRTEIIVNTLHPKKYEPDGFVPASIVKSTEFYPSWERIKGSDLVETEYRGISMTFCDLTLTHSSGKSEVTDFEGTFIMFECDRQIRPPVMIGEGNSVFSDRIETENQEFNNRFSIKGDDLTEVMYVLTPHFMEKIIQADDHAESKTSMRFDGNWVYIMLNNKKNLFEFDKAETEGEYRIICMKDIEYVLQYVDILIENTALFDQSRITAKEAQG